jgi:hypothetical protein
MLRGVRGAHGERPAAATVISLTCAARGFGYEASILILRAKWSSQMAAIARLLFRSYLGPAEIETLEIIVLFCGLGLVASLLLTINGLDVNAGLF